MLIFQNDVELVPVNVKKLEPASQEALFNLIRRRRATWDRAE
jgi:hypothetical protein